MRWGSTRCAPGTVIDGAQCVTGSILRECPACAKPVRVEHVPRARPWAGGAPAVCLALQWMVQIRGAQTLISERNRTGQGGAARVASGACKAFWDDLDVLAPGALAQVTLFLFITRFPGGRSHQCARRHVGWSCLRLRGRGARGEEPRTGEPPTHMASHQGHKLG